MIECVCVSLGGLAALMYTDTFQTFVIIAGALVLTGFCKYNLCNIIFNYLMNLVFNSHNRRPMLSACLKAWCPEAAQAGKRLTRVRNHSFWWTIHCADTAEPPRNPQPPTDTTIAARNCNLIDFSWKGQYIHQSGTGYEKSNGDKIRAREQWREKKTPPPYVNWFWEDCTDSAADSYLQLGQFQTRGKLSSTGLSRKHCVFIEARVLKHQ